MWVLSFRSKMAPGFGEIRTHYTRVWIYISLTPCADTVVCTKYKAIYFNLQGLELAYAKDSTCVMAPEEDLLLQVYCSSGVCELHLWVNVGNHCILLPIWQTKAIRQLQLFWLPGGSPQELKISKFFMLASHLVHLRFSEHAGVNWYCRRCELALDTHIWFLCRLSVTGFVSKWFKSRVDSVIVPIFQWYYFAEDFFFCYCHRNFHFCILEYNLKWDSVLKFLSEL